MKTILIVVPAIYKIGGIRTSLINLLNNIVNNSDKISLCILSNNIYDDIQLPKNIRLVKAPVAIVKSI